MIGIDQTIISQYAQSDSVVTLIRGLNSVIDPQQDLQDFYKLVFDVETAEGFGLDWWGKIVNVQRGIPISAGGDVFGFDGSLLNPWDQGNFASFDDTLYYIATDAVFRRMILLKAARNISGSSIPAINTMIGEFFKDQGTCYVVNTGVMSMRYVFNFALFPWQESLFNNTDLFPRPAGVFIDYIENIFQNFGFDGSGLDPYNQTPFFHD